MARNHMQLTKRTLRTELMDDPDIDPGALEESLDALARSNRRLGGVRAVLREFQRWSRDWRNKNTIRVLDMGTGSADIPIALAKWAPNHSLNLHITAIDRHPITLDIARQRTTGYPNIELVRADARKLIDLYKPRSFDYVHAGLFLHHLPDIEVLTVLRIMDRLSSRGLIWNDLVRSPLTRLAIYPFSWLAPSVFKHDSLASRDAGFTRREARDIAKRVGLENVRYRQVLMHRFILTSEKKC